MKRFINFFPAALAVLAFASCSDYEEQALSQQTQLGETKIVATIDKGDVTRVGMARNAETGDRGLVFTNGDLLNVYTLSSTQFCAYKAQNLPETTDAEGVTWQTANDEVEFAFDAANSSAGVSEFDLTDGKDYYAVTRTGADQKIYALSAGSNGPELSLSIPSKFTKNDVMAQWSNNSKEGKGYTFPLPLWGKVVAGTKNIGNSANVMVNLRYLTGFLGINLTTMRAGTKSIKITADKAISGYFHTVLNPDLDDKAAATLSITATSTPDNLLAPHEALTTSKEIEVELPEANDYEGATDMFYVPLIAQQYSTLTIEAYDADGVLIQQLYALPAGKTYTAKRGKGVTLETGMVVRSNLTDGLEISKKIYELCQRNKEFTLGLYNNLTTNQTIYIDKNATSTINIQMLSMGAAPVVTGNITIVEATPKTFDEAGFVTEWETDITSQSSLSATKKHTVNFIYNSSVVNTGAINFWLPNAAASIVDDGSGTEPYKGKIKSLTASDGGFTIEGTLNPNAVASAYENYKDGAVTVNGYTQYLFQNGTAAVTINNLSKAMQEIHMGQNGSPVAGALTINGAAQTGNGNGATVNTLAYFSTGAFLAHQLDGVPTGKWTFNETAASVTIENGKIANVGDAKYISYVPELVFNNQNNLTIDNAWIAKFDYKATVKANVVAKNKSAIKDIESDGNDLLTVSSEWNGKKLATTDVAKGAAATLADMLLTTGTEIDPGEIHTAFQLANVPATGGYYAMKSTTVMDMKCGASANKWVGNANTAAISINGDANNQGAQATVKNLYNKPNTGVDNAAGLFASSTNDVTLKNLVFDGVSFENYKAIGALVGSTTAKVTIENVEVKGNVSLKAANVSGNTDHVFAGGLAGKVGGDASLTKVKVSGLELSATAKSTSAKKQSAYAGGLIGMAAATTITTAELTANSITASGASDDNVAIAGGLIGNETGEAILNNITATVTTVSAEDNAGGAIGYLSGKLTVAVDGIDQNTITATTVKAVEASATMAAGGLVGTLKNADGSVKSTKVTAGLQGLLNMGGLVGNFDATGSKLTFGDGTKATLCEVAATFALVSALNTDANKTAFKDNFGSANTYVGNVAAGNVVIKQWCKHGAPISTVAAKTALNFKENVVVITDGVNKNYLYFWGGNPWVGTVNTASTINFPDASNVEGARTNETDYNVRKDKNYYKVDNWTADWE